MKKIFIAVLFLSSLCEARILIRAPQASTENFMTFLSGHGGTSLSDYQASRIRSNPRQEEKLFALADLPAGEVSTALVSINSLRSEGPLSELSLRFLKDLTARWLSLLGPSPARAEVHHLFCAVSLLLKSQPQDCQSHTENLSELHRKAPWAEQLMVEGLAHSISAEGHFFLQPEGRYHFTLLSNSHDKFQFYGTYQELLQQEFTSRPLTDGVCEGFATNTDDLTLQMQASVYFSDGCVKVLHETAPPQTPGWFERNKLWIYPAAALVMGAGVFALKDKKVVIDSPALR